MVDMGQWTVISYQLPVTSYQLSVISEELNRSLVTDYWLLVTLRWTALQGGDDLRQRN